jgi:outer membrane immunogenic protein
MRVFLGSVAAIAMITSASAADLPMKAAAPAPVMAPVWNWNGFYIGVNGGYSWGRAGRDITFVNPVTGLAIVTAAGTGTTGDSNLNGGLFGGQIGYNWQTSNWVFGLETDAQWTGQRGSTTALCPATSAVVPGPCLPGLTFVPVGAFGTAATLDQKLEWFGTFRGRVGVAVVPSVLLYATGGAAYGTLKTNLGLTGFTANGTPVTAAGSSSDTRLGWTVGGGIEAMFAANWSAKIEYLYMDLGTVSSTALFPTATGVALGASLNSRITDNIIRGGINYHFSAGPGPVVARY